MSRNECSCRIAKASKPKLYQGPWKMWGSECLAQRSLSHCGNSVYSLFCSPVLSAEHLLQPLNLQYLVLFYGRTSVLLRNQHHPSYLLSASSVLPPGLNEANCKTISFEYVSLILPYPLPFVCLQSYLIFNRYWFCEILLP